MENFSENQEQIRHYIEGTFGKFFPVNQFEDMTKHNIVLFQQAAKMFNPAVDAGPGEEAPAADKGSSKDATSTKIQDISKKIESLQKELDQLIEAEKSKSP